MTPQNGSLNSQVSSEQLFFRFPHARQLTIGGNTHPVTPAFCHPWLVEVFIAPVPQPARSPEARAFSLISGLLPCTLEMSFLLGFA